MIHVCSLSRLHRTVEETGARHVVTLLRDVHLVTRPECIAADKHLMLGMDDIPEPADGYVAPGEEHVRKLIAFARGWDRADAAGRALLCRHQPLDRGRVRDRLRAQSRPAPNCGSRRSCGSAPTPPRPTAASCRSPTTCSAATAAWSTRSMPSGPARRPTRRSRSGWIWNSASPPAFAACFVNGALPAIVASCSNCANREFTSVSVALGVDRTRSRRPC